MGIGRTNGAAMVSASLRYGRGQAKRKAAATAYWHPRGKRGIRVSHKPQFQGIGTNGQPIWS
jgi:hypothetical protein